MERVNIRGRSSSHAAADADAIHDDIGGNESDLPQGTDGGANDRTKNSHAEILHNRQTDGKPEKHETGTDASHGRVTAPVPDTVPVKSFSGRSARSEFSSSMRPLPETFSSISLTPERTSRPRGAT